MNEYELICLALEEIRRQAYNLYRLKNDMEVMTKTAKRKRKRDYQGYIDNSNLVLKGTFVSLRDNVLEHIAQYNNRIENVSELDAALAKLPFDLIYESFKAEQQEQQR